MRCCWAPVWAACWPAWQTTVGSDPTLPEVVGPRPISMRITNAYLERVMTAAETDPVVAGQFMRGTTMVDSPIRLLRPTMLLRGMRAKRGRRTDMQSVAEGFAGSLLPGCDELVPQSSRPTEVTATRGEM